MAKCRRTACPTVIGGGVPGFPHVDDALVRYCHVCARAINVGAGCVLIPRNLDEVVEALRRKHDLGMHADQLLALAESLVTAFPAEVSDVSSAADVLVAVVRRQADVEG